MRFIVPGLLPSIYCYAASFSAAQYVSSDTLLSFFCWTLPCDLLGGANPLILSPDPALALAARALRGHGLPDMAQRDALGRPRLMPWKDLFLPLPVPFSTLVSDWIVASAPPVDRD